MATFSATNKPKPIDISKWLGINEAVGETEVDPGEWIAGFNARVTKDYKISKRPGHHTFINFGDGDVQGVWYGQIGGKEIFLSCWNGNVYEYDMSVTSEFIEIADLIAEGTVSIIGTLTDAKTSIFWFYDKIYFLNGTDYKEYDGTTFQDVEAYIPTTLIGADPDGSGTLFEEINLLGSAKQINFVGDGSSTVYQLTEDDIDSVDTVTVNGVEQTPTTDYSVNLSLGQVTFVSAPSSEASVQIIYSKDNGNQGLVLNHMYAVDFGVNNDTNLFIFGNPNEKAVYRFSGVAKANYFPVNSFVTAGSTEFAITSMIAQYQSLLVFKEDATKIINPTENPNYDDNTGLNPYDYGYQGLNDRFGNIAPDGVQLINDTPVSMQRYTMRQFVSNRSVRNEIEPVIISDRLKLSLQDIDLSEAVTFDYEYEKELWVNVEDIVYIWNYGNDTMYKYSNVQAKCYVDVKGDIYYGGIGMVERFNEDYLADGQEQGTTIPLKLYGGFLDFGALEYRKNMRNEWLAIKPETRTSVRVKFVTDRKNEEAARWYDDAQYILFDFNDIDFNDFSFLTNRSAQPIRIRGKVKKFVYLQWIFENDTNDESLVILKLLLNTEVRGYSK